ncbi:hypothetical protein ACMGE5_00245 [Macrococcus equi]|uniref:DUF805 domain-containing protein n=1 Tax=Macrococcus equi TaxID=3395462 RepID=UPI0039BE53B8
MDTYINFWKNIFNIKSEADRKEFNLEFWPHLLIILTVFLIGPMLGLPELGFNLKQPLFEMLFELNWRLYHFIVLIIFLVPMITLMLRRCRDLRIEGVHAILIGFFPVTYLIYMLIFAIVGQGLPADVLWVEIIYYVILSLPLIYLIYMLGVFSLKRGKI